VVGMAKTLFVLACCTLPLGNSQSISIIGSLCHRDEVTLTMCSGRGQCTAYGCECYAGWFGSACSMRHCPEGNAWADVPHAKDQAHRTAVCSNKGTCDYTTGMCLCDEGFKGAACDRLACPGAITECNGHGECVSSRSFTNIVYHMDYSEMWDVDKIWGCICDSPYTGYDCSERKCPLGDDPMTENQLDTVQMLKCDLGNDALAKTFFYLGWKGNDSYRWAYSPRIYWDDTEDVVSKKINSIPLLGRVDVAFMASGIYTACAGMEVADGDGGVTVESPQFIRIKFRQDYGDLEPIAIKFPEDPKLRAPLVDVACTTNNVHFPCASKQWAFGANSYLSVLGTKESLECGRRGTCDATTGTCLCHTTLTNGDYRSSDGEGNPGQRGDCAYQFEPVFHCDYGGNLVDCSGHGTCSNYLDTVADHTEIYCACFDNWRSYDCLQRSCPYGKAWFGAPIPNSVDTSLVAAHVKAECSNRGLCDRVNGVCICQEGFEGAACELFSCPTSLDANAIEVPCSGHGNCHSMAALAQLHGTSYGATPHDPMVWDHDQIMGCVCDEGWKGYNCAYRECPRGDHVRSDGSVEYAMECSGNGDCDSLTGSCNCYHGYSASNGHGAVGYVPDCGYYVPIQFLTAAAVVT